MQWPYVTGDHSKFEEKQNGIFGLTPSIFPESQVTVNPRIFGPRVLETRASEKMKEIGNALMLKQLPSYIPLLGSSLISPVSLLTQSHGVLNLLED